MVEEYHQVLPVSYTHLDGEKVTYKEFIYLMLNKPDGYISATFDKRDPIVLDLIDKEDLVFEPFPVGRLDKDTEGLLVLTNDGQLAHRVLSVSYTHLDVYKRQQMVCYLQEIY